MEFIELTEELIESVDRKSAGLPYPHLVKNLKAVGIDNYVVKVGSQKVTYTSRNGEKLTVHGKIEPFECAETFHIEKVKEAIKKTQEGQIDYITFLQEIGAAGIQSYVADLSGMTIIYQGPNSEYEYEESIPVV